MKTILAILCTLVGLLAGPASAQAADTAIATPPSDATNYLSDRIKFQFAMQVLLVDMTASPHTTSAACAPAFTTFRGIGTLALTTDKSPNPAFIVTQVGAPSARCGSAKLVAVDDIVIIRSGDFASTPPDRYGLTYGMLLVPFKYHFTGDKDFTGSTSLGGYLGFRQDRSGITGLATQYVAFLGASSVEVGQTVNGQSTSQNLTGVSYGIGMLGTVKDAFHMGVVLGADRVNKNAGYKDNGKAWLAVSLGYSFSN